VPTSAEIRETALIIGIKKLNKIVAIKQAGTGRTKLDEAYGSSIFQAGSDILTIGNTRSFAISSIRVFWSSYIYCQTDTKLGKIMDVISIYEYWVKKYQLFGI